MSYDILLYPRRAGQDWTEVVEADEEETDDDVLLDQTVLADGVSTFGRIEARLREQVTGPVETWVAEEAGGDVFGEFTATDTGLQVELFHGSAAVSFPDGEHDDPDSVRELVQQAVAIVAEETGYEAYDPQTEDTFDGTFAEEAGREDTRVLSGEVIQEGGPGGAGGADPQTARRVDPRQEPAFLRRRGLLYLVIGVLLTLYGLWRLLSAGGTGWITIVVLAIGVLDLVGGLMMLSLARTAAERDEAEQGSGQQ